MRTEQFRIKGPDILPNYLLDPVSIAQFFQEAFAYQCADLGLAAYDLQKNERSWVLMDLKMEFLAPLPRWRELLELKLWTRAVQGLRLFEDFQAVYQGEVIAQGTSGWLIINEATRRPMPIETVSKAFQVDDMAVFADFKFRKRKFPTTISNQLNYTIHAADIDFNHHLNSIRYIDLALEAVPLTFRDSHVLKGFEVRYHKEAYLRDELLIEVAAQDDACFLHQLVDARTRELKCTLLTAWEVV